MGQAIGQVVSFGVAVALSPVPIIAVVLMLATPKGPTNGLALLAGRILGIAVPGTLGFYLLMRDNATELLAALHDWMTRENTTIMAVICLIIGAKLIGDAITALSG